MSPEEEKQRIQTIQSALAGASPKVWQETANYIHTEALIDPTIKLLCCSGNPPATLSPVVDVVSKPQPPKKQKPLWVPVHEMFAVQVAPVVEGYKCMHPHIAKGAHVKCTSIGGNSFEAIVTAKSDKMVWVYLMEKGYDLQISYASITHINALNAGQPDEGFGIKWDKKKYPLPEE